MTQLSDEVVEKVARAIGPGGYVDDSLRAAAVRALVASEWAAYRNFIEEIAGSCIPDYEEAKRDAQDLLSLAKAKGGSVPNMYTNIGQP